MKRTLIYLLTFLLTIPLSAQQDTTAFMRQLIAVHGVSSVSPLQSNFYKEKYVLKLLQNVDGDDASHGTFGQRLIVGLRGLDRPTVMVTEGYFAYYALQPNYVEELCKLFDANVVVCEYRYFAESVPQPCNWDYMTVDNSLRDLHHVRQALGTIFHGKWISTGISKGGQTTMFYRATYPNDVDVSVSYVAPLNRAVEDGRHEHFLTHEVGTKAERKAILHAQQELMRRKTRMLPRLTQLAQEKQYHFNLPVEEIYDYCVLEFPFALWQWGTSVETLPKLDADDEAWWQCFVANAGPEYFSCPSEFTPFHVQAARELGYYGYSSKGLKKWQTIKTTKGYLNRIMLPKELQGIQFDNRLYQRTCKYLQENDPRHIFIYGEIDPWSASGVAGWLDCSKKHNMRIYVQPRGSHRSRISNMPDDIKADIMQRLSSWLK